MKSWRRYGFIPVLLGSAVAAGAIPTPYKVVVVIEENHAYEQIIGAADAPYINAIAARSALFTDSHGVGRPSQPNYLALFSGSTQGVEDNGKHPKFDAPNLYTDLAAVGRTVAGYSHSLPYDGYDGEFSDRGAYARKHNPLPQFVGIPDSANRVFDAAHFPTAAGTDYSFLPDVSFVIPDQNYDMHDGSVISGDAWFEMNLSSYICWAATHDSLLIFTFDEDDFTEANHIATFFYGPMVQPGLYGERIDHYTMFHTIESFYIPAGGTTVGNVWVPEPAAIVPLATSATALVRRRVR